MSRNWLWWSSLIILLLRSDYIVINAASESSEELDVDVTSAETTTAISTTTTEAGPKTADELGVPRCTNNYQCVNNGVCVKDADGHGRCLCPRSCTPSIPLSCKGRRASDRLPCLVMGDHYSSKYSMNDPTCHKTRCVCPPMFESGQVTPSQFKYPTRSILPVKCDRRELKVIGVAHPSESVYKGADVKLYCCINIDPTNHIDAIGVSFVQNETVSREPTEHPFKERLSEVAQLMTPSCWELEITNVQLSDSGSYMCLVTPSGDYPSVNDTIEFQVKEHEKRHHLWFKRAKKLSHRPVAKLPRMIQNLTTKPRVTGVNVTWDVQEGPQLKIDLRLYRRTGFEKVNVWNRTNAISPVQIDDLRAATPYTLSVTVKDGQMDPFELSEHFTTADALPDRPKSVLARVGYNSGPAATGSSLNCEVEWRAPSTPNGRIINYYVRVRGELRRDRPDGILVPADYPSAVDKKCANWDESEQAAHGINPIEFSTALLFCKFGPLKPNRNYSVTVWAENSAGRSSPMISKETCVTQYAQPDVVEKPATSAGANHTSFSLSFDTKPDDTNGPISCYYIAVVPLPANVSLESLPSPQEIVMDTFAKAFANNMQPPSDRKVYFAYIAESYADLPLDTVIGDGTHVEGIKPCSVPYLSRHPAEDSALRSGLKYTGFLIVRVDNPKEREKGRSSSTSRSMRQNDFTSRILDSSRRQRVHRQSSSRSLRQLPQSFSGPVYGFSQYFKPVFLQDDHGGSVLGTVFKIVVPLILFVIMVGVLVLFFMQRRGIVPDWCPLMKLSKDVEDRIQLKPATYTPIPVDDLPSEYLIRHRDSDFMFGQEYESLPHFTTMSALASKRSKNVIKNRYNDINAFDETRVKLKKLDGIEDSDYINANFVNGWDGRKKFIAAQAPLEKTVDDFWRMIWEQECQLVVMVANLLEKNRQQCIKYWPDDEPMETGNLLVTPVSSNYNAYYTVRAFDVVDVRGSRLSPSRRSDFGGSVESELGSEYANVPRQNGRVTTPLCDHGVRRIVQYHFTNWNDYRAPECTTGLLRFLHRLRGLNEFTDSPVLIHCSAGVGRTGTFIAIDSMLDQCAMEGKADIFGFVAGLRKQRNLMVQSQEQYVFIYKALAEWHLFGYTDMDLSQFKDHYHHLMDPAMRDRSGSFSGATRLVIRPDSHAPLNGMEAEFRKLNQSLETAPKISFAGQDENIMKNRFAAAVPYDRNRVVLQPMIGYADSSYINASEIKGYFYPYILAQDPVSESTVFDFWRMISEKQVTTLVMLSQEEDWSSSEKYWPEEVNQLTVVQRQPHSINVMLTEEDRYPYYVVRKMIYQTKNGDKQWHSVTQFCVTDWPAERVVPEKTDSLLSLIGRVLETQSKLPESGPIVLHCRDGSSQTGVFCCVSLLLERWRAEQRVDVFQTVKGLQIQRPMLFSKLEEYQFCYKAVLDYIRCSGIY